MNMTLYPWCRGEVRWDDVVCNAVCRKGDTSVAKCCEMPVLSSDLVPATDCGARRHVVIGDGGVLDALRNLVRAIRGTK